MPRRASVRVVAAATAVLALSAGPRARAFCGFFVAGSDAKLSNTASQVVLLRNGHRTVMTIQNNYQGPPQDFALVVPVPVVLKKEDVKTLPRDVFDHLDSLSAPRLVEYWEEDPCDTRRYEVERRQKGGVEFDDEGGTDRLGGHGVKVEARFAVGEYEIVILSAQDSGGLDAWLRQNRYRIPDGAAGALAPYVRDQMKFFVAKVNIQKVQRDAQGVVQLSPLRFGFPSSDLRLPVRLGLLNAPAPGRSSGKQELIVYVLHPTARFEVANYRNVFIPTNLEVTNEVRRSFGPFYADLFDATLKPFDNKAVVTEYAWQTTSCDPCPTPPLEPSDLATFGADIGAPEDDAARSRRPASGAGGFFGTSASWVLTRLHARYDRQSLSDDLVFKEAPPVVGGRAGWDGRSEGSTEATPARENNFQARYIIRHYWSGPVACQNPQYGIWGGPPDGREPSPAVASGLAGAKRGGLPLKQAVRSPVPRLGLPGHPRPKRQGER